MKNESLTGLKGSHPLGFMAALGLLRCLSASGEFGIPRLYWEEQSDWVAVLSIEKPVNRDELIDFLIKWTTQRNVSPEFNWADRIGVEPNKFTTKAREIVDKTTPTDRCIADFFVAFSCELILNDGKLRRTAFDMTDGQQGLMKSVRELAKSVVQRKQGRETFQEALFGPWQYEDTQHSLGWDPSTESLYALRANDPTVSKNQKKRSVRAAIYLAAEALPLFPCAPEGSKLVTRGFSEIPKEERTKTERKEAKEIVFSWPVWRNPLCLEEIRSLLALKTLTWEKPPLSELRAIGIAEVFRSHKIKTGGDQGNRYIFRTAYPCTEAKR